MTSVRARLVRVANVMIQSVRPSLSGVRAKIARAKHHSDYVETAIKRVLGSKVKMRLPPQQFQADREPLILKSPKPEPLDAALPLAIGDCVHNLRSALDHLAFQLAGLIGKSAEAETKIAFPICLTARDFRAAVRQKVKPFISPAALAAIKEVQPYATENLRADAVLWILSQLDIIDKHRLIVVVEQQLRPIGVTVKVHSGERFEFGVPDSKWKPLKDGTEIIRLDLSRAINTPGKVRVNVQTLARVQLSDTGLMCDGHPVQETLSECHRVVSFIVDDFGKKFFGE